MTSMKSSFASAMTSCNVKCNPTSQIQKSIQTRGPMVRAPWYSKCGDHCVEPQRNPLCSSGAINWLRGKDFRRQFMQGTERNVDDFRACFTHASKVFGRFSPWGAHHGAQIPTEKDTKYFSATLHRKCRKYFY